MIDSFSILLSHALLLIMLWRLLGRDDIDRERPAPELRDQARAERGDSGEADTGSGWLNRPGRNGGGGRNA